MSSEKHDEFSSWRSLLGSRDALPEHALDSRDRTWEKLTRRLQPQPAGRRHLVYWMAAACLFLVLIPAALFVHSDRKIPAATVAAPGPAQAPTVRQYIYRAEGDVIFRSAEVTPRAKPLTRRTARSTAPPAPAVPEAGPLPIPEVQLVQPPITMQQQPPIGEAPSRDSAHIALTARQLRVVHINEIGNPNHSEPAMTSRDKRNGALDIRAVILLKTRQ